MSEPRNPKPGEVIWADRISKGLPYNHCGVYEGGGYVIHSAVPEGSETSQENALIHRITLAEFKDNGDLTIIDLPQAYPADEILRRARSRIGEGGFTANNADHFATWCRIGEYRSIQVDNAKAVVRSLGGVVAESAVIGIARDYKASILSIADRINRPRELLDRLRLNSDLTIALPMQAEQDAQQTDAGFLEDEPVEAEKRAAWYERLAGRLIRWTYPIAGGLEVARRIGLLPPPFNLINYNNLGAKVRNGIDNVLTVFKAATGRIPVLDGIKEYQRNRIAHLGDLALHKLMEQKQQHPVKAAVKQAFGKAGSGIGYIAQQALAAIVPPAARTAIKTGAQAIGRAAASGIRTAGSALASAGRSVAGFFTGRR